MPDIGWGILGTGAIASLFAESLLGVRGAQLVAVGSRDRARAEAFAAVFRAGRAHGSAEALVRDPGVDVVYVATDNQLHEEHCMLAIAAGKAVLCEKPFAIDALSGARVIDAARRAGVFCMEAMWMRFSPVVREAVSLIRSGAIGDVRLVDAQLGFPYDPGAAARLFSPSVGALRDLGVYALSFVQAILGAPEHIQGESVIGDAGADEQTAALLVYAGGRQAIVAASLRVQLRNCATVHGTAGVLHVEAPLYFPHRYRYVETPLHGAMRRGEPGAAARLRTRRWARAVLELRNRRRERGVVRRVSGTGYAEEAAEVQRCLREGLRESREMPLDATLQVLEAMDAIRLAASRRV